VRKDSFLRGAFVATLYIIAGKVMGVLYVIPFYTIIGERGGALYSYAYSTYELFLTLSTVGVPLAVSKIVSEYNTRGFYKAQNTVFRIAKIITTTTAFISTLVLFFCAPIISKHIVGDVSGVTQPPDVTFVIRVVSTALLFVAVLGSTRGYLQGNHYISVSSSSQILEQLVRVSFIIFGSYISINVLKLSSTYAVGVAVFGATVGAIVSYFYLRCRILKEKDLKFADYKLTKEEKNITNKIIVKKLILTTIPFVVLNIISSCYSFVNSLTVVKTLSSKCGFSGVQSESILAIISNWGFKLNSIVSSVAGGVVVNVLPNLTKYLVLENLHQIREKINKTLQIVLFMTIPMATGLSLLADPVWNIFYGNKSEFGPSVFSFSVFVSIFSSVELNVNVIMHSLGKFKAVYFACFLGFAINATLNIPLMILFGKLGLGAYNGASFSTILGLTISASTSLISLKKSYNISYKKTIKEIFISLIATSLMTSLILVFNKVLPIKNENKVFSMLIVLFYFLLGALVYFVVTYKTKSIYRIFGKNVFKKIRSIIKI
jgi:O-antigen/teichoic acid export membrane protein